ncbi:MAG: hypothetical protein IIB61_05130, partial [Planctomycetes bacterium]|nr:hypothetical protein [Planctomycetota bacterium]
MRKRSRKGWSRTHWFTTTGLLLAAVGWSAVAESVFAGERQFLVMLANSPKQYSSEDMEGQPPGGLVD